MSSWLQNETRGDSLKFPAGKPKISSKRKQIIYFLFLRHDSLYPRLAADYYVVEGDIEPLILLPDM